MMDKEPFEKHIQAFRDRLRTLLNIGKESDREETVLYQAYEDLHTLLEELEVSTEELRQKNDELTQAHDRIAAEQARYRELFEFAPDGYLVTDGSGKILEANRSISRLLQIQPEFLIGKPIAAYIAVAERKGFRNRLARLSTSPLVDRTEGWEVGIQPRSGPAFTAAVTVGISHDPGEGGEGKVLRWIVHDISAKVAAQQALEATQAKLEQRVEERTAQLSQANEKLKAAALQMERKNRELQDFAFIASHDLQEPLRKIQMFGDRLQAKIGDTLDEEGKDYIQRMGSAAARMQAMITQLLDYARVNTSGSEFVPTDLTRIVQEVLADLDAQVLRTQGRIEVGDLPTVRADPSQMQRLFQNLIANALKFHRPDVPPEVRIRAEEDSDRRVKIIVQDNGIGIPTEYREQIFQPFHRLHGRSAYEGTGMGLVICQRIAERHGGRISVRDLTGEGATFEVDLPAMGEEEETGGPISP